MQSQNSLFPALECSNRANSDLDKLMEALFFIRGGGLASKSPFAARRARRRQLRHPHLPEAWDARRYLFSPAAGAEAVGDGGGTGGAGVALLNSFPLLTRLLQGWSERSPGAPSKPTM